MKKDRIILIVIFLLLVITVGNCIIIPEISASSDENPYDTSQFKSQGYLGLKPDIYEIEMIFLRSSGIWMKHIPLNEAEILLFSNDSIDYTFSGPKFSPDGEKIVFIQRSKPTGFRLIVLEQSSSNWNGNITFHAIYSTERLGLRQPSFSSDGKKIIYFSLEEGGNGDVWSIATDGTNRIRLTFDDDGGRSPSVSPDGTKIVYGRSSDQGEEELWLMNSDGSNQKKILRDSWYAHNPVFMPNGNILFDSARVSPHSDTVGAPSIWMMEQDGSNRTLLVPNVISSLGSMYPSINRNGTRILFEHGIGDGQDLYIVDDPDGDGEWEDSDGDHVADICDGYPFDPDRGYIKDDESSIYNFTRVEVIAVLVLIAIPIVLWRKRSK